jgi:hypothetical protein
MKSVIVITLFFLSFFMSSANAQQGKKMLTVMGGYSFEDEVNFYDTYGKIKDGVQWSIGFEYFIAPNRSIDLTYTRMDTRLPIYGYTLGNKLNEGKDGLSINYILIGGTNYFPIGSPALKPYAGAGIGIGIADGKEVDVSYTKFAWDAKLGLQIMASPGLSFKIQTQLQSIAQGVSGGFYVGTGGAGVGTVTYSSVYQFGFSGGLAFSF